MTSPFGKLLQINADIRLQIAHVRKALQARLHASSTDQEIIRQALTKIRLWAMSIV